MKEIKINKGWATNSSSYSQAIGKKKLSEFNKENIKFITDGIGVGNNSSDIDVLYFDLSSINSDNNVPFVIKFDDCDSQLLNIFAVKMSDELSEYFEEDSCLNYDNEEMESFDWEDNAKEISLQYYNHTWLLNGEVKYPKKFSTSDFNAKKQMTLQDLESCSEKLKLTEDILDNLTVIPYIYQNEKYFILLSSYLIWFAKNSFINGNYNLVIFNDVLGMRNSIRIGDEKAIPKYPEMVDIKITNNCKVGCNWCYQDSKNEIDTEELNLEFIKETVNQLPDYVELAIGGGDILEVNFLDDLFNLIKRFSSRNFTINYKSLQKAVKTNDIDKIEKFKRCFNFASAIGISINNAKQLDDTIAILKALKYSKKEINKVCFHIIPDIMEFSEIENVIAHASNVNCGVLLLGYKVFGRGVKYQEKTNNHPIRAMKRLINSNYNNLYIKVDTKFTVDYELKRINIHEGEFSCNIDAPLKTVSPSSWRNKEQFYQGDFVQAFRNIREAQGFYN